MIGGTGSYGEILVILICWILLNPIFITVYFQKSITKKNNSRGKKIIALVLFYILILLLAQLSLQLIHIIKSNSFLIISIISSVFLIFILGSKNDNE